MAQDSREEYLESIYSILEDGSEVSTTELASRLRVKPSSVTQMLKKLAGEGYILYRPYHGVSLTVKGFSAASRMKRKHRLLECFLHDTLGIGKRKVHTEACEMEHCLSDEATDAMDKFLGRPKECPDDKRVIPRGVESKNTTLAHLGEGDIGIVTSIEGAGLQSKLMGMGLFVGKMLRVIAVEPLGGPVVVKVGNTSLTVGRNMASKVKVIM
jgi:DtxR family transcriptional regulator, Mn-dependent transcriptional regulator